MAGLRIQRVSHASAEAAQQLQEVRRRLSTALVGPPVVLVQGLATVRDADLQANTDRYVRVSLAKAPAAFKGQPKLLLRTLDWYFTRMWVQVTPTRVWWWDSPALTSERWAKDFDEIKRLGGKTSTDRTPQQSLMARYRITPNMTPSLRLIADVPVGCFLSGGVDSSAVVALASEMSDGPLETFSIGFADSRFDERPYARLVADRFATRHHEFVLEPTGVVGLG